MSVHQRRGRAALAAAAVGALVAGGVAATPTSAGAATSAGGYIVVLKEGGPERSRGVAAEHARAHGAVVSHTYGVALPGYAAVLTERGRTLVARDPRVAAVVPDGEVTTQVTAQIGATWGLDRTDQPDLPLSGTFSYGNTGAGVTAYVIDTGIRTTHGEFESRATTGYDAIGGRGSGSDCNGHGTHVAGTIGGKTYGIAKGVKLVAVRVLDCRGSGSWSGVIAGIDWVTKQTARPAVANMSLGGGTNSAVDTAVSNSIKSGVSYAVAAGNGDSLGRAQDACTTSPARVPEAITISASDASDAKISWANYGNCVDWFAPGANITSAWHSSNTATNTISGTSMAAPHAAGVAALHLQSKPTDSPSAVRDALYALTTKDRVTSSGTSNNHLLYTAY